MDKFITKTPRKGQPPQPPAPSKKDNSKDKKKDEQHLTINKQGSKQAKQEEPKKVENFGKSNERSSSNKKNEHKIVEEKPLSIGKRTSETKSPKKNLKTKEKSPSPPKRQTRSSDTKKDPKQNKSKSPPPKKVSPPKKLQSPKKQDKKIPNQQKKNKMEIEKDSKTEVEQSGTESLTDHIISEEEKIIPKKSKGTPQKKGKTAIQSDDNEESIKQSKTLPKKSPQKAVNKKTMIDEDEEDLDNEEQLKDKSKSKVNTLNSKKSLVMDNANKNKKNFIDESDDEEVKNEKVQDKKQTVNKQKANDSNKQDIAPKTSNITSKTAQKEKTEVAGNTSSTGNQLAREIIVFTGELDGVSRDTLKKIITDHGGKNTTTISGKTTLLVHGTVLEDGRKPEEGNKYKEAQKKGTKIMNQDKFSEFLKNKIGKSLEELSNPNQGGKFDRFASNKSAINVQLPTVQEKSNQQEIKKPSDSNKPKTLQPINKPKELKKYDPKAKISGVADPASQQQNNQQSSEKKQQQATGQMKNMNQNSALLWTDKHAPKKIDICVGNQKNFEKMMEWLQDWVDVVIKGNKKKLKNNFYNRNNPAGDNSSNVNAKACLLSGPPGVGKTTSVRLIAKFMGYEVREWNASDERSKKRVNSIIGELKNNSIIHLLKKSNPADDNKKADDETVASANKKFIILMDEVDGMSSGDRGGNQALIDAIKNTNVPIFCICNDRMNPKIRSLANYCYDIKFVKPPKQDVAKHMKKICEEEGFKDIDTEALEIISERFGNDIRQTLNYLQMHFKNNKSLLKKNLAQLNVGQKDATVMMEGFEASQQLMQSYRFQKMTLRQRVELFFIDYDLIPLLVHQSYLDTIQSTNEKTKEKRNYSIKDLQNLVEATSSIAESDILSTQIRQNGNWSLLHNLAFLSSIYPCDKVCEDKPIYPKFPEWLGKFQTTKKTTRELREFRVSISKAISGSRFAVKFDYVPTMLKVILHLLKQGGDSNIEEVLEFLDNYHIKPEHLKEHLNDLQYPKLDYYSAVPTDVKSKLTREYNKRFSDDSRKIKVNKKSAPKGDEHLKYDKNLDDVVYSETEEQDSLDNDIEDENDDENAAKPKTQKSKNITKQQKQKKDQKPKTTKNKKSTQKDEETEEIEEEQSNEVSDN